MRDTSLNSPVVVVDRTEKEKERERETARCLNPVMPGYRLKNTGWTTAVSRLPINPGHNNKSFHDEYARIIAVRLCPVRR